jgi:MFS family permease
MVLEPTPMIAKQQEEKVEIWFFWGDGCSLCESAADWLDQLQINYPSLVIHSKEVWKDSENQTQYIQMMDERGTKASWVPGFILDDQVWEGFNVVIKEDIIWEIETILSGGHFVDVSSPIPPSKPKSAIGSSYLRVKGIKNKPLLLATMAIALVDGFNPCSLWVLTLLLTMIMSTQSRTRVAAVGLTFLVVTAIVYGLFISGLFTALIVANRLVWLRGVVILFALGFAIICIKDYLVLTKSNSIAITDAQVPRFLHRVGDLRNEQSLPVALTITIVLAFSGALIELPCTAGFPVVWIGIVTEAALSPLAFFALLFVYLIVYLMIEIIIILITLVSMRVTKIQEVHGYTLKLIGGIIMGAMAIMLLIAPSVLNSLTGIILTIAACLIVTALISKVRRRCRA